MGFISGFTVPDNLTPWVGWARDDVIPPCAWTGVNAQACRLAGLQRVWSIRSLHVSVIAGAGAAFTQAVHLQAI